MSKPSSSSMTAIDPSSPTGATGPNNAGGAGGGNGVFRLDSLAPGSESPDGLATPPRRKISAQTIFLLLLVIGGGGMIYGMRLVGIGPLSALAFTQMPDYDLTKTGSKTAEHKKVLDQLSAANVKTQVPVDQVQKNPFMMADVLAPDAKGEGEDVTSKASAERAKREAEARRRKVESALNELKLHGVIGGSNPVARISGQAVRVGDTLSEVFTVKAIHSRSVDLEYDGQIFPLSLDDDDANKNANGPKKK